MYHLSFYVPEDQKEKVKEACFKAGAGRIGNYDFCSFEFLGLGQFRPLEGSRPFIGSANVLERVSEIKVEMVCDAQYIDEVIAALKSSHPYETPAYYVTKTLDL